MASPHAIIRQPTAYRQIPHPSSMETGDHHQEFSPPSTPASEIKTYVPDPRLFHLKKGLVQGFLAGFVGLTLIVIGLAAFLGVSQGNLHSMSNNLREAQQALSAAFPASTPPPKTIYLPTPTLILPPSTTLNTNLTNTNITTTQCPFVNGTIFTSNSTTNSKTFLLLCGLDYAGNGEATDIGSVQVTNLTACAEACAKRDRCTGAGWGSMPGDTGTDHTCWMKTDLIKSHKTVGGWGFAMLLGEGV